MDQRQWFRMLVCFLPGLVLGKLAGTQDAGSFLSLIASAILVVGIVTFVMWNRVRARFQPEPDADTDAAMEAVVEDAPAALAPTEVPGEALLADLAELRALCGEQEPESIRLIATELMVNPGTSFAVATRAALSRRRVLGK
jgi:hypothetical protein